MEKEYLDYVLVPVGLLLMLAYHIWLLYRVVKHPTQTVSGVNAINRRIWVHEMMENTSKNGILAIQTLRNNIMASTVFASMAISLIAVLMTNGRCSSNGVQSYLLIYGNKSQLGFSIKSFSILLCFLLAFLLNVQSIRYYSHAGILINVGNSPHLSADYVAKSVDRGSHLCSLGLRAFYFSFPLFLWFFGPIPMFFCCLILVFLFYFLDISFDCSSCQTNRVDDDDVERGS